MIIAGGDFPVDPVHIYGQLEVSTAQFDREMGHIEYPDFWKSAYVMWGVFSMTLRIKVL